MNYAIILIIYKEMEMMEKYNQLRATAITAIVFGFFAMLQPVEAYLSVTNRSEIPVGASLVLPAILMEYMIIVSILTIWRIIKLSKLLENKLALGAAVGMLVGGIMGIFNVITVFGGILNIIAGIIMLVAIMQKKVLIMLSTVYDYF